MKWLEFKPILTWIMLMVLTALSVLVAESGVAGVGTIALLFSFAAVKSILVMVSYMEVNCAKQHWQTLYIGWVAVIAVVLFVGCL